MKVVFKQKFVVTFDEADPGGILFFARHFSYAHRLIENFVRQTSIEWQGWYGQAGFGVPLRHVEADYKRPLQVGHEYEARLSVEHVGDSSVKFKTEMFEGDELCSTVLTTHVFFDTKTKKKMPIPPHIRQILSV